MFLGHLLRIKNPPQCANSRQIVFERLKKRGALGILLKRINMQNYMITGKKDTIANNPCQSYNHKIHKKYKMMENPTAASCHNQ